MKAWASSVAMGPPPIMAMLAGARSSWKTFSLVRKPASARPGISGTAGRLPVHRRTNLAPSSASPPEPVTTMLCGPVRRAAPNTISTPISR